MKRVDPPVQLSLPFEQTISNMFVVRDVYLINGIFCDGHELFINFHFNHEAPISFQNSLRSFFERNGVTPSFYLQTDGGTPIVVRHSLGFVMDMRVYAPNGKNIHIFCNHINQRVNNPLREAWTSWITNSIIIMVA